VAALVEEASEAGNSLTPGGRRVMGVRRTADSVDASLSLVDVAWWERRMPASVSCVALLDGAVLSGDWDGMIECRSFDGELLWSCETSDRIGSFAIDQREDGTVLHATCGREVVRIDPEDGNEMWRVVLDGSADLSVPGPDGGVWVTSAVYEIELNDFIECSCTLLDAEGVVAGSVTFDERPWHIEAVPGGVMLGLGRPRSGILMLEMTEGGLVHSHIDLGDSPITCGISGRTRIVLGHADGCLTALKVEEGEVVSSRPFPEIGVGIETIDCTPEGLVVVGSEGRIRHLSSDGEEIWSCDLDHAAAPLADGPSLGDGEHSIWATAWSGIESRLVALDAVDGSILARFDEKTRFRTIAGDENRLAIGLDDGRVVLLDAEMLRRRSTSLDEAEENVDDGIDDSDEESEDAERDPLAGGLVDEEERRAAMRDRLRKLRGG